LIKEKYHRRRETHSGGYHGFRTDYHRFPETHVCIIVLSNFEHAKPSKICDALSAMVFGETPIIPIKPPRYILDPEIYDSYTGLYVSNRYKITVKRENQQMLFLFRNKYANTIYPVSETVFHDE